MAAKFDARQLRLSFANSDMFKNTALEMAQSIMEDAKNELAEEFDNHVITQEIDGGPEEGNISTTLYGQGNLFSFIGFENGDNPTDNVRRDVSKLKVIQNGSKKTITGDGCKIEFKTTAGDIRDFEKNTPLPWEQGKSWLTGIEQGIGGFGAYISAKLKGRSEGGYQEDHNLRSLSFKRMSYFTKMYNKFLRKLGSNKF